MDYKNRQTYVHPCSNRALMAPPASIDLDVPVSHTSSYASRDEHRSAADCHSHKRCQVPHTFIPVSYVLFLLRNALLASRPLYRAVPRSDKHPLTEDRNSHLLFAFPPRPPKGLSPPPVSGESPPRDSFFGETEVISAPGHTC